jgi:hypothetical protein
MSSRHVSPISECGKCGQGLLNKLSQITLYDDVIAWKSLEDSIDIELLKYGVKFVLRGEKLYFNNASDHEVTL